MDQSERIRKLAIVDLVNSYATSARLKNCIKKAQRENRLPFETVGDYLDQGSSARDRLLKIRDLGQKTANEFTLLITTLKSANLPEEPQPEKKEYSEQIRQIRIVDLVKRYATSARLKNRIAEAEVVNTLPFDTIGDYLDAGARSKNRLRNIHGLGRKTGSEVIHLIETFVGRGLSENSKYQKRHDLSKTLSERYPGVFDPLINEYSDTSKEDVLTLEKLERILSELCDKKSKNADMVWFRFSGETLDAIGKSYGVTRERVRQITSKYQEYVTETNATWAEKSVRHLIAKNKNGNRLPDNVQLDSYHSKLSQSLVSFFSRKKKGKLTPERRLDIAKSLRLDLHCELISQKKWNLEKVIYEVRRFAQELGNPTLMPMQKDFTEYGRMDLRGVVGRFGGQSKVAALADLVYQGQMVAPDGTRRYWTDERIRDFLYEVAEREGHASTMPTQSEVRKHAPNASTIAIFTREPYPNQPTRSWFELAKEVGLRFEKRTHKVTTAFIRSFVRSLGDSLYHLSPAEIYVLFEQQGISKAGTNLYRNRSFDNLVGAIQSGYLPREEIERWTGGEKGKLIEALLDPEINTIEEAFQEAGRLQRKTAHKSKIENPNDAPYREDLESQLPVPSAGDTLSSLRTSTDLLIHASSDSEAVQFFIAKAADKLWKRCFHDETAAVDEAKRHKGNIYSESARDSFIEEYTRCTQLPLPTGYSFRDPTGQSRPPKLMQRLVAYRVLTKERVLNLSGTGTGKTLSAILASRVIGARLTIITCPNAIVEAWRNTILNAFPNSEVVTKPIRWNPDWGATDLPRYVVVNHEMLQNRYESDIKRFIRNNPYDLVVIDELHQVKQRDSERETQRRRILAGLITDTPGDRPKPRVLGMGATPVINNLQEGKSLIELVTSLAHEDIGVKPNVHNCMRMYQRFTTLGFRMMPKNEISREPQIYPVDATPVLGELLSLGTRPHPQKVEAVLVRARWPIIKSCLRRKTVIFTEYVMDIVPVLSKLVEAAGFTVGVYTGDEKYARSMGYRNAIHEFIDGDTDVLIASIRTLATGVDGLQYVCNNVVFASLPWTSADYDQAIGRFDREGFVFDRLDIHIPKTYTLLSTGEEWSWCESRLRRLENKRDIAKAAVDGEIPDSESQLTPEKATQYWMGWLRRLNEEGLFEIERREIRVPLDESNVEVSRRRYAVYGDFSRLNSRWNASHSSKTHERLSKTPEEWCFYHTRLLEREETWQIVPRIECVKHLRDNLPRGSVVGDFGCGQGKLADELVDFHIVHSFDHVAIHPGIVACDMAHTHLDDGTLDAVVFSLSLMGSNTNDYLDEAYRVLKLGGQLIIWHPAEQSNTRLLAGGLRQNGFALVEEGQVYKWRRVWAIKQARKRERRS
ncbi:MAG: helicase-related protein [Acidobacteriota bacterium]